MAERNSIQQNDPAIVEWAGRITLDQIPGLLLVLASRWLIETTAKANEQDTIADPPPEPRDRGRTRQAPQSARVLGSHRGTTRSNSKRQARQIRPLQIERCGTEPRSKATPKAVNGSFSCHSGRLDVGRDLTLVVST